MLALCGEAAYAQTQLVKIISDENETLSYSTVYINGKAYATADRNAVLNIPREMLKVGDTISASYVGYENGQVIYDGYRKGGYVICLNMGQLEKVTIFGRKETRKAFRTINSLMPVARTMDYSFRFVMDKNGKEVCRGDFYHYFNFSPDELSIDLDHEKKMTATMHNRIYVELADKHIPALDDKKKVEELRYSILPTLQEVFYVTSRSVATDLMHINLSATKVRMTAEKGKITTFMLSREGNGKASDGRIISSSVFVDVDTLSRNVVEARMDIQRTDGNLKLVATYSTFQYFRYPNVIEATFQKKDGTVYNIDIYDTHIMRKKKEKMRIFKKDNSVNIWVLNSELFAPFKGIITAGQNSEIYKKDMLGGVNSDIYLREKLEMLSLINITEW